MLDNPPRAAATDTESLTTSTPSQEDWGRQLYRGLHLLLWTMIIEWLMIHGAAVMIPLGAMYFGALDRAHEFYRWVDVVPALTGIPLLIAIFRLTSRQPEDLGHQWIGVIRIALRFLIGFELFARWVAFPTGWAAVVWRVWNLTYRIEIILLSVYLVVFAVAFGRKRLARQVAFAGLALAAAPPTLAVVLGWLSEWVTISDRVHLRATVLVNVMTGVAAIWVLSHYCQMWRRFVDRQCLNCSYPLRGLTTRRCPECGTQFGRFHKGENVEMILGVEGEED